MEKISVDSRPRFDGGAVQESRNKREDLPKFERRSPLAREFAAGTDHKFERMSLVLLFFNIPRSAHQEIFDRWAHFNYPALPQFAPYTAYGLGVEIFFQLSIAAHLISSDRPSNRTDIAYLFYLPFCHIFISLDKLHRKTASLFLRGDQQFVWGQDLKTDLARINTYFEAYPENEKSRGIIAMARIPPNAESSLVADIWNEHCPGWRNRDEKKSPATEETGKEILERLNAMKNAPTLPVSLAPTPGEEDYAALERRVHKRKGSWWQLPSDLEVDQDD